jgi:hypothetical protein
VTATIAAVAGVTNYVEGVLITGMGATAAAAVAGSITGLQGGTLAFRISIPAGVTTPINALLLTFVDPLPASGVNVAVACAIGSFGAGNTEASVTIWGFQQ